MNWHLDVLPAEQRALWDHRLCRGFAGFVLYGGTALALRLGHRQSVDFDFFSSRAFAPLEFRERHGLEGEILQAGANTLTTLHRGVKLSFFGGLFLGVIAPPDELEACPVASLDDLGACKLAALVNRVEGKDYLDVAALLRHGVSLAHLLGCANAVYHGEFPVTVCLKSLVWFDAPELSALPLADREILEAAALAIDEVPDIALGAPRIATGFPLAGEAARGDTRPPDED